MTDETNRDDPARIPGDPNPRYRGHEPITDDDIAAAEAWWREAPEDIQLLLRTLAAPMSMLGFPEEVIEALGEETTLASLLAIGDMEHIAREIHDSWAVWRFLRHFEDTIGLPGEQKLRLYVDMDLSEVLPYLKEGGIVPEDA